ncbi:hypothetical protein LOD99_14894 [Oopsacas minuta]|uniref:Uncharacterized protein n=1 Tax=Oopsacas minuta TaxID=111878 RepID=A0AAV7KDR7_9METZ|nr:hypothetical protein LOD99_14894 [Oopsacas minuta]
MVEIIPSGLNATQEEVLIIPVKILLEKILTGIIGVVLIIICCCVSCCVVCCVVCYRIGERSVQNETTRKVKPRLERDGTIYSEVNPAGMIENQRGNIRLNCRQNVVLTSFANTHTLPPTPTSLPTTPTTPPSTTLTTTEQTIAQTNSRNKFQKSISTESAYQEMLPTHLRFKESRMDSIDEICDRDDISDTFVAST